MPGRNLRLAETEHPAPEIDRSDAPAQGAELPGKITFPAEAGEAIRIETPGGGGYGAPGTGKGEAPAAPDG